MLCYVDFKKYELLVNCLTINVKAKLFAWSHKSLWISEGVAPLILNLDTKWRQSISFTLQTINVRGNNPQHAFTARLGWPHSRAERFRVGKTPFPCRGLNHYFLVFQPLAKTLCLLSYPGKCLTSVNILLYFCDGRGSFRLIFCVNYQATNVFSTPFFGGGGGECAPSIFFAFS
jgi:hypothetical protein